MSGIRVYNFREGDRSEYLANYLLSGLGLVTGVPRQEDIGFDFYCQLADQEKGNLSFGYPFIVSVKSDEKSPIIFGNSDAKKWKREDISWIRRLHIPILFGIVNKKAMRIDLYNCSVMRYIFLGNPDPSIIEFRPRVPNSDSDVGKPVVEQIDAWEEGKGDGNKYIVDLGNPIVTIQNEDIYDHDVLAKRKNILRNIIQMEQNNILYSNLTLPHFHWALKVDTNEGFHAGWAYFTAENVAVLENHYRTLGPGLISMAINLKVNKQDELLTQIIPLLKQIPKDIIPQGLKDKHPEIFS